MPIEWKPEFATGEQKVDAQHQHLFDYVNTLHGVVEQVQGGAPINGAAVESLLFDLDTYINLHFTYEEMCMSIRRCPLAKANHSAHKRLEEFYAGFREQAKQGVTLEMLVSLEGTMVDWLTNHICHVDIALRDAKK